ncbi:MAG: peptidoglycan-binding lipoprotein, OmpA family [Deltaproteobacteria bacterium]|nr:peptidoglycan-binding lipoprotein, OmpA family [Deltaproteobacteria bacterium]
MRNRSVPKVVAVAVACLFLAGFAGCAGREYAPKRGIMYYHKELPAADRAVEAARAAGKDKACPAEFQAAEKSRNEAYEIYWSCRTQEAIAKANEATGLANALCPKKVEAPKPAPVVVPPPPPPPPAPTASISANPVYVYAGQCTTLSWSTQNAAEAMIDPGVGNVEQTGSKQVCPGDNTQYTITAKNAAGDSVTASTTVPVYKRTTLHINFDTNKADIRKADHPELQNAIDFVKMYPDTKISVVGYTDSRGDEKYNLKLSQRRADAVKKYLVDSGNVKADMITAEGRGEADPVGDNKTKEGQFQNRRVEIREQVK